MVFIGYKNQPQIICHVGGVATLVVAVVALHHVVILDLLDHLDLVNAPLAVRPRGGPRHITEACWRGLSSLALVTSCHSLGGEVGGAVLLRVVGVVMQVVRPAPRVEGEGVDQGLAAPRGGAVTAELAGAQGTGGPQQRYEKKLKINVKQ